MQRKEDRLQERDVIGKRIYVPRMRRYLRSMHQIGGWDAEDAKETQGEGFQFNGQIFTRYAQEVLNRKIKRVYFPAAYTGKVAKALVDVGFDVFTSDLSDFWVGHQRSLGLHAEKRSFEDLPNERFDIIVSFEPWCIPPPVAYIAMLRMLSKDLPYVEISLDNSASYNINRDLRTIADRDAGKDMGFALIPNPEYEARLKNYVKSGIYDLHTKGAKRPIVLSDFSEGRSFEYGAHYEAHFCYDGRKVFSFNSFIPTPLAVEQASFDLQLLEILDRRRSSNALSLKKLSKQYMLDLEKITAALARLCELFSYCGYERKIQHLVLTTEIVE